MKIVYVLGVDWRNGVQRSGGKSCRKALSTLGVWVVDAQFGQTGHWKDLRSTSGGREDLDGTGLDEDRFDEDDFDEDFEDELD